MHYTAKVVQVVRKSNFCESKGKESSMKKVSKPIIEVKAKVTRAGYKHEHKIIKVDGVTTHAFARQNKVFLILEERNDGTGSCRVCYSE